MDVPDQEFYVVIPEGVIELGMGPIAVYAALRSFADYRTGEAWPSVAKIGERVGISAPTTRKYLDALHEAGWITSAENYGPDGRQTSNRYIVHGSPHSAAGPRKNAPSTSPKIVSPPPQECLPELIPNELIPKGTTFDQAFNETVSFESFWHNYPRKVGKPQARKAWAKAVTRAPAVTIMDAATRYAYDPNRDDQFTKHPATWLNGDGWNDPPLPERSTGTVTTARQRLKPLIDGLGLDHNLQPRKELS